MQACIRACICLHRSLHGRVQMSLELRSETYAGGSCFTDYAYLKVGVPQFNALRPEASSCAPRRLSSSCRAEVFNKSLSRTPDKH